jgi:tRNA (guanine-N7-)-methyltransferase
MAGKDARALDPGVVTHGCALPHELFPDWPRDFGRDAPLELEIGPGRGHFALDHAAANPGIDLVAIETRRSDCELIRARAHGRGLRNLIVVQGDAKLLVPRLFAPATLSALHVQFPDPWWKKRHQKRRLVDVELAASMRSLLRQGAYVDFRTDVEAYARAAVQTWEEAGFANAAGPGQLWSEPPEVLSTRERRYAKTGQPVYRARFLNPAQGTAAPARGSRTGREWSDVRRK